MANEQPAVVAGSSHTVRTLVDGTLALTIHIEPRHAQQAFAMFGTPGTPVAVARLVPEAVQQAVQREAVEDRERRWGHVYQDLFRLGWFHNPRVCLAFGADMGMTPDQRIQHIKQTVYVHGEVESLADLSPARFVWICEERGIRDTLPASIVDAARGRPL